MKKKLGWILSLTLCFALMIAATLVTASASASVSYIDANGDEQTCASATVVTAGDATWGDDGNNGWYVVNGDVTINTRVTVTGDVHLILADECTLNASQGITVADNDSDVNNGSTNSLTIYGQSGGTGKLTATGDWNQAGIGGGQYGAGGTITINGGTVTANGGYASAGIGGGYNGAGGTITINGGTVTANSEDAGAGIGGGSGNNGGTITINGGTVTATGGSGGAGIGSGRAGGAGGTITINGGHVTANGSQGSQYYYCAGIGGGFQGAGGSIKINGGVVEAHGGWTGIGSGEQASAESTCEVTVKGGVVTATGDNSAGIGGIFSTGNAVIIASSISDKDNTTGWSGLIITKTQGEGKIYGSNSCEIVNDLEIPEGYTLTIESGKTLTIPEGVTLTNNGTITVESGGTLTNNGTIVNNGSITGTVSGSGKVVVNTYYLNTDNETTNQQAIPVTTGSTTWGANDTNEHWYVVNGDVTIDQRVTVTGDVHLILADECTLNASQGITVTGDNSLTIYAQSAGEGMGKLTANAVWERAAIGSKQSQAAGNITICGGNITAAGGGSAAIGNVNGEAGTVTIYGGWVKATGAYTDADSVSSWAEPAMRWAVENGIVTGVTDSTLAPQGTATRAQCAAMLMRFAEL